MAIWSAKSSPVASNPSNLTHKRFAETGAPAPSLANMLRGTESSCRHFLRRLSQHVGLDATIPQGGFGGIELEIGRRRYGAEGLSVVHRQRRRAVATENRRAPQRRVESVEKNHRGLEGEGPRSSQARSRYLLAQILLRLAHRAPFVARGKGQPGGQFAAEVKLELKLNVGRE